MDRVVAAFLARDANVDARDGAGYAPVMQASLTRRVRILDFVLREGSMERSELEGYSELCPIPKGLCDDLSRVFAEYGTSQTPAAPRSVLPLLSCFRDFRSDTSYEWIDCRAQGGVSCGRSMKAAAVDRVDESEVQTCTGMPSWKDALAPHAHYSHGTMHLRHTSTNPRLGKIRASCHAMYARVSMVSASHIHDPCSGFSTPRGAQDVCDDFPPRNE